MSTFHVLLSLGGIPYFVVQNRWAFGLSRFSWPLAMKRMGLSLKGTRPKNLNGKGQKKTMSPPYDNPVRERFKRY